MLTFPVKRVAVQPFGDDGAFYSAKFKRENHPLSRFRHEDDTISAFDMLKEFRKEVKACVESIKGALIAYFCQAQ